MKYKEIALTTILICLVILILTLYTKPTPNRYHFVPSTSMGAEGVMVNLSTIQDTATGKIYTWIDFTDTSKNKAGIPSSVTMNDPIHNKTYPKLVKSLKKDK